MQIIEKRILATTNNTITETKKITCTNKYHGVIIMKLDDTQKSNNVLPIPYPPMKVRSRCASLSRLTGTFGYSYSRVYVCHGSFVRDFPRRMEDDLVETPIATIS